ncbi:hypothetical protein ColTof3_07452 [Colletotrichum tofieldiae]|nr:hypothetical protein ColTof3_07452 [Colletotrichum tofieldiae]
MDPSYYSGTFMAPKSVLDLVREDISSSRWPIHRSQGKGRKYVKEGGGREMPVHNPISDPWHFRKCEKTQNKLAASPVLLSHPVSPISPVPSAPKKLRGSRAELPSAPQSPRPSPNDAGTRGGDSWLQSAHAAFAHLRAFELNPEAPPGSRGGPLRTNRPLSGALHYVITQRPWGVMVHPTGLRRSSDQPSPFQEAVL